MSVKEVITRACEARMSGDFLVGANISDRKLQNARANHEVDADERIIAMVDMTVFGSAKHSAIFTDRQLSVFNSWGTDIRAWRMPWEEFMNVAVHHSGNKKDLDVYVDRFVINLAGSSMDPPKLVDILKYVQAQLKAYAEATPYEVREVAKPIAPPSEGGNRDEATWMVARAGETFGPFTEAQVIEAVIKGRFDRTTDYVWKAGMPDWRRIEDVDVFRQQTPPPLPANDELPPLPGGVPPLPKKHRP